MAEGSKEVKLHNNCVNCPVCSSPTGTGGAGDFVTCGKCLVGIHTSCYHLHGELLKVYEDYLEKNVDFPFVTICTKCRRQFLPSDQNQNTYEEDVKVKMEIDATGDADGEIVNVQQNPFDIDNIVEIIQKKMNLNDLKNSRLVSKTWNKNGSILQSKLSRQDGLNSIIIDQSRFPNETETILQLLRNSENKKIFRKFTFLTSIIKRNKMSATVLNQNEIFQNIFEIIDLTHPYEISFVSEESNVKVDEADYYLDVNLFSTFLNKISPFVVRFSINIYTRRPELLDDLQLMEFPQIEVLEFGNMQKSSSEWIKNLIENCPKLKNLQFDMSGMNRDDVDSIDEFITGTSEGILSEKMAQNLQILDLRSTDFVCLEFLANFEMKLKSLSISPLELQVHFGPTVFHNLSPFLTSLKDSLKELKIYFTVDEFNNSDAFEDIPVEQLQIEIPRLENVEYFELKFDNNDKKLHDENVWPLKEINLPEIFPNLKKIFITYNKDWEMSFAPKFPCQSVKELVLHKWSDGDFTKIVQLFPQIEHLKLNKFSFKSIIGKNGYSDISNINGWAETLKKIDINCQQYHLKYFNFNVLYNLPKLEEIFLSLSVSRSDNHLNNSYFIHPDFTPLQNMPKLSKLTIKNFKISKCIIEDCREKFEKLDFTYYL